jgi:putative two-component system response regulator
MAHAFTAPLRELDPQTKPTTVLVVDDDDGARRLFERLLTRQGYIVETAPDGPSALAAVLDSPPDVVLLDVMLPEVSGVEICRQLKRESATRLTPVILVTGMNDGGRRVEGLEAGADDFLGKPVDPNELLARVGAVTRLKRYTDDLDSAASIIMTLAVMIEARDGCNAGHCHRMANYAAALGRALDLTADEVQALHRGGFLHDIGMLAIPDGILRKAQALEPAELELVQSHTVIGDQLCANLRSLQAVRPIVRSHHERLDGSGYPDGLRGDDIPLVAQIMTIVDIYEAVTTDRPYQGAQSVAEAIEILRRQVERGWHRRDVVEAFAALIGQGRLGS